MWIFVHISGVHCRIFFGVKIVFKYKRVQNEMYIYFVLNLLPQR